MNSNTLHFYTDLNNMLCSDNTLLIYTDLNDILYSNKNYKKLRM